jgi:hypothetical protein
MVGWLLATLAITAAAVEPSLELDVTAAAVTVGDHVDVRVHARGGEDWLWGDLTVRVDQQGAWAVVGGPVELSGSRPPVWSVTLAAMETGELELPELSVGARMPGGEGRTISATDRPVVTVASVLPPEGEAEPAPLRNPLGVHGLPWEWLVPILIVLIPAMALQYWWLNRRRGADDDLFDSHLPPIEQFEKLADELTSQVGVVAADELCDRLAGGYRRYLERRTGEPTLEMTSFEMRVLARARSWPETTQRSIHRVMQVVDSVRFGRRRVPEGELGQAVAAALEGAHDLERHLTPTDGEDELEAVS